MAHFRAFVLSTAVTALFITACTPDRIKQTDALKQQMADMKPKRITNADMVETVNVLGERISKAVQSDLLDDLQKANGPAERARLCQLQKLPRLTAIEEKYGVDIQLVSGKDVQNQSLSTKEREVLDAYLYNAEQKLPQISNIQKINDTLFVYNAAVPTDNIICQTCFGDQKTPLAVWRILFPKREVVRRVAIKKK
ncbi:hypothetical protein [Spirosoma montaniterrae]|uniref:Uncharacterized protein n=1 Tax=Spirosoma montaniterrae TaxID=1178516 RepID=A0A1P9X0Q2_9BACT|nr:hypothetical protein [Spirosoma montaniterrae]AQG81163.1 hypothetical protein AWR27_18660 [Spirosoma montaniterrae]